MKKKPEALKLAELQRSALQGAIESLNRLQVNGGYMLSQKGFAYCIMWAYDNYGPYVPITEWLTFRQVKDWIQEEKRCLK